MKLRVALLPILIFTSFGYSVSVLDRVTDHGKNKIELSKVVAQVKADLAKFEPSNTFVYNK